MLFVRIEYACSIVTACIGDTLVSTLIDTRVTTLIDTRVSTLIDTLVSTLIDTRAEMRQLFESTIVKRERRFCSQVSDAPCTLIYLFKATILMLIRPVFNFLQVLQLLFIRSFIRDNFFPHNKRVLYCILLRPEMSPDIVLFCPMLGLFSAFSDDFIFFSRFTFQYYKVR